MELNLSRVWFFLLVICALVLGSLIPAMRWEQLVRPVSGHLVGKDMVPRILAAGYVGAGESWGGQLARKIYALRGPQGVCSLELPALALNMLDVKSAPSPSRAEAAARRGQIFIYNTHTTESYIPDEGKDRTEGRPGLITRVAQTLGDELTEEGYQVTVCKTMHDWPDFTLSYNKSRHSVQEYLKDHPRPVAVIDVHRDALPQKQALTVDIEGRSAAPILIIMGTDQRKPHPHRRENMRFAQRIMEQGNRMYPGLIRGVRPKAGVYNQDLSTRGILIEVGTDRNTLEQARYSAHLFGRVLTKTLGSDAE